MAGSRALIVGHGAVGRDEQRLRGFDVRVTGVTRSGSNGTLRPDQWKSVVGQFDWIVLAAPSTHATRCLVGAEELSAMKNDAVLINVARGSLVDQDALLEALMAKRIHAAMLDVTDPEPLPAEHPLWAMSNAHITMHLSGRSQDTMMYLAAERLMANLERYALGEVLEPLFDPGLGC